MFRNSKNIRLLLTRKDNRGQSYLALWPETISRKLSSEENITHYYSQDYSLHIGRRGQIDGTLTAHVGDRVFGSRLSQTNDL